MSRDTTLQHCLFGEAPIAVKTPDNGPRNALHDVERKRWHGTIPSPEDYGDCWFLHMSSQIFEDSQYESMVQVFSRAPHKWPLHEIPAQVCRSLGRERRETIRFYGLRYGRCHADDTITTLPSQCDWRHSFERLVDSPMRLPEFLEFAQLSIRDDLPAPECGRVLNLLNLHASVIIVEYSTLEPKTWQSCVVDCGDGRIRSLGISDPLGAFDTRPENEAPHP